MGYRVNEGNSVEGERVEWTASPPLKRDPASKGSGQMSGPTRMVYLRRLMILNSWETSE